MKKIFLTGIFALTLSSTVIASDYGSVYITKYNLPSIVSNSYIRGVISQGDVTRWNTTHMPLKVYIQTKNVPSNYIEQLKRAYMSWQNATDKKVRFTLVNFPEDADLKCIFANNIPDSSEDTAGIHQFTFSGNKIAGSTIWFRLTDKYGNPYSPELFYTIALHEIGHSLGLAGHSSNPKDLMYPVTGARSESFSKRDLTTFKLLYSMLPDNTNISFTEGEKKKLFTKTQVIGGETRLKEDAETAAEINKKITPNDPNTRLRLAIAYQENKNYTAAINEYKSAAALIDSSEIKSEIYYQIAECYISLKNYSAARNCAIYVNKNYPTERSAILPAKIQYANGQTQLAVKTLLPLWNNEHNQHAGLMLKNIYYENKNNPTIKNLIERDMRF